MERRYERDCVEREEIEGVPKIARGHPFPSHDRAGCRAVPPQKGSAGVTSAGAIREREPAAADVQVRQAEQKLEPSVDPPIGQIPGEQERGRR